jgi:hypothetical protein
MKTVRYTGLSSVREVSAHDFKSNGVENQGLIRVRGRNAITSRNVKTGRLPETIEVSDEAADMLVNGGDFEVVETATAPEEKPKK